MHHAIDDEGLGSTRQVFPFEKRSIFADFDRESLLAIKEIVESFHHIQ